VRSHKPAEYGLPPCCFKEDAHSGKNSQIISALKIPNRFVIGYGLDFDKKAETSKIYI